jgi:undecaprenyl diphosphate synthase
VAHAPLDRSLARPTDAPPLAHEAADEAPVVVSADVQAPLLPPDELPRHVAIIMDGNRRWARSRGKADFEGHAAGVEAIRGLLRHAVRRGVPMLTLYAFRLLGRLEELPDATRASITGALAQTAEGTRLDLNIAWNYAGRTELVDAFRRILATGVAPEQVDERTISEALYTGGLPDPDLVIRTGGEQRISNFLIWQSAYAELVFDECLWPDFGPASFDAALLEFARRNRRFGR